MSWAFFMLTQNLNDYEKATTYPSCFHIPRRQNSFAQNPIPAPESNYNDQAISQFRKATFLSGLLVNSIAVPRTLEMTDSRALAAGLLTAGASYFAPKYLIRDENITQASADAYSQFFTRGYLHSILLNAHLKSSEVSGDSPISFDQRKGINTLLFSNLEAYGHFALARAFNASEGAIALSKNLHDITFANALFYTIAADNYSAEALVYPSIVGSATAYYLGNLTNYTRGDAHVSSAASVLGSATGMWFYYSMDKLGDGGNYGNWKWSSGLCHCICSGRNCRYCFRTLPCKKIRPRTPDWTRG